MDKLDILVCYDGLKHSFDVLFAEGNVIIGEPISIPFLFNDKDSKGVLFDYQKHNDYGYEIFVKSDSRENEIFQVYESKLGDRIGWIFPLSSIVSVEHNYFENPHYCRYVFYAYFFLLNYVKQEELLQYDFKEILPKSYENTIIFVYSKEKTIKIDNFNVSNYYCSLYKYGYYLKEKERNPGSLALPIEGKLVVTPISSDFIGDNFINDFFRTLFFEEHHIIRFHIFYQIIEMLIQDILIIKLETDIQNIRAKKIFFRDFQDTIKSDSEKKRIKTLVDACRAERSYDSLHKNCNEFLLKKERDSESELPFSLYAFRNFIVHDFRFMIEDKDVININSQFELLVLDLLSSYTREKITDSLRQAMKQAKRQAKKQAQRQQIVD